MDTGRYALEAALIYAVNPERIRIVAFAHQKRRPFYWRKRLKNTAKWEGATASCALRRARLGEITGKTDNLAKVICLD
ncbi:MAG: hypothetical protein AB9866_08490 [Syntrophobacteraceae bacterium]